MKLLPKVNKFVSKIKLFISYSSPNYSKLTNIFLDSLSNINVKNINHMLDENIPNVLFQETGFNTDLWYYCIRNKINHLINVLNNYDSLTHTKYFIFTDCDVNYIKNNIHEWDNLEQDIIQENKDIFFMHEHSGMVNSGFFVIKNNDNIKNIINFFVEVLQTIDTSEKKDMPLGDQSIINNLKHKINYGFVSNEYVIFGSHIFNKEKSLFHHAVCCNDVDDKIIQINNIKSLFNK